MKPLVSVVIATYRREDSLKKAIESIVNQTYKEYEIILVDDNANEEWNKKVAVIVNDFQKKFPDINIQYIVNESNLGSAKTRNIGIVKSQGNYVTFLDDDDLYLPNKIERQITFMENGNYDYSITDLNLYNENDKLIDKRVRNYIKDIAPDSLLGYHLKYHLTGTDAMMFRKEYLVNIGGFAPIDIGDEFYLMQRAINGNGKFGYLPQSDIKAYIHTGCGGLSSGEGKIKGENDLYEYKKKYFNNLSAQDIRYIKMRHYAVLAFAYLRMKKFGSAIKNGGLSFFAAPVYFCKLLLQMKF